MASALAAFIGVIPVASSAFGAVRTKSATGTDLTAGASWGGTAPTTTDTATWSTGSLGGAETIGSNVSWARSTLRRQPPVSPRAEAAPSRCSAVKPFTRRPTPSSTWLRAAPTLTIGNAIDLNGGSNGAGGITGNRLFTVNQNTVLNGAISNGQFVTSGSASLTLNSASNAMSGLYINGGTVLVGNASALGTTDSLTINGGTLASADNTALSFASGVSLSLVASTAAVFGQTTGGTGTLTFAGTTVLSTAGGFRTFTANTDVTLSGVVSGSNTAALTKNGAGTLTLANAANSYVGASGFGYTTVSAGTLAVTRLANHNVASSIGETVLASTAASIKLDGGTLAYIDGGGSASSTDRLLQIGNTTAAATGTILNNASSASNTVTFANTNAIQYGTVDQTRTLILGGSNTGSNTIASIINDNGSGSVSLGKQDGGTWALTGVNNYSGGTTISAGTLFANNATSALGSGAVNLNGGTLSGNGTIANGTNALTINGGIVAPARRRPPSES